MDSENYNFCFQVHVHAGRTVINEYFFFLYIQAYMYIMCVYISTCSKYKYTSYSKHHLHVAINFNTCICNIAIREIILFFFLNHDGYHDS